MQMSMGVYEYDAMSADMPGCESMHSSQTEKAKDFFCKFTTQCQLGSLYHPVSPTGITRPAGLSSTVVFHYVQSLPVREPTGPWRPPRAI